MMLRFLRRLPRPIRYRAISFYYRWCTGWFHGRYVAWGATRRLDVQIGSPRDLRLAKAEADRVRANRAWAEACRRSAT